MSSDPTPAGGPTRESAAQADGLALALEAALVGAGGAVGALARAAVAALVAAGGGGGILATQLVNGLGAFALGGLLGRHERLGPQPRARAFLGIGVLGSFTTFSTLIDDGLGLAGRASSGIAAGRVVGSLAIGLALFALGHRLARGDRRGTGIRPAATGTRDGMRR